MTTCAPPSLADPARLAALAATGLMDGPTEAAFDRLTTLAARVLDVPIALVSLVDDRRQFFKSAVGLPEPVATARQTPLSHSFCKHVVLSHEPLVVADAREHPMLKDNPVIGIGVIAYAGFPIRAADGQVLGSFCAIDTKPREWTAEQVEILRELTASVMTEVEVRRANADLARANAELTRVNDELRAANATKERFMAMLSHDLRTPLAPALLTAARMAADPSLADAVRSDARLVQRNIRLQVRMIDSLLDMTRIASGKLSLRREPVDVDDLLRSCARMCEADARGRGAGVGVDLDLRAARTLVAGDRGKLTQAVCNVLGNAIKFSPDGGRVTVRAVDAGDGGAGEGAVRIEVVDRGTGIAADAIGRIFEPYEQGGHDVTRRFGGLGLGLAITRGIVEAHDGSIAAASDGPGRGTTIFITLAARVPDRRPAASPAAPPPAAASAAVAAPARILLVEDHEDSLRVMARFLRSLGHDVTAAGCCADALAAADVTAAAGQRFDLLVSDVGLPDGSGLDLMRRLRGRGPIKGIALTGYGTEADVREATDAGFDDHLTKPVGVPEFVAAVERLTREVTPAFRHP